MQVRIKHENEVRSQMLGDVPLTGDAIDEVMRLLRNWGVDCSGESMADVMGQFVVDDSGAYFEVIVTEDA